MVAHICGDTVQRLCPLVGWCPPPFWKGGFGSLDGGLRILRGAAGYFCQHLLSRRVDDREALSGISIGEFAVDPHLFIL